MERPQFARTEAAAMRMVMVNDLPPVQAGLSAALRRAFEIPRDECERQLEELLRKLA